VFENKVLRKMFGPTWGEMTGDWTRLHSEELYEMYCLLNFIGLVKSRRVW
jgi:hypothetical protein